MTSFRATVYDTPDWFAVVVVVVLVVVVHVFVVPPPWASIFSTKYITPICTVVVCVLD